MSLCSQERHIWSWGSNGSSDTPPPHIRCTCGRVRWGDQDELQALRAALDAERARTAELLEAFGSAARSYHNIAQHGGPPHDFEGCQQRVCIYWRALLALPPDGAEGDE